VRPHPTAATGYGVAADAYERARPDYPEQLLDALTAELGLGPSSVVVELGAGTGKFTRLLAPRVGTLIATEPIAAMRRHLASVPCVVMAATAEAVPLADQSVDAVVAATSFHWFDADLALAEAHRVLRPSGGLGLAWNNPDRRVDWVARVWGAVDEFRGSVPTNLDERWQQAFEQGERFGPLKVVRFAHSVTLSRDDLLARVASVSFVAALPADERRALLKRITGSIEDLASCGDLTLPYRSEVYLCRPAT
jgi:SAM-dependent methyltransferase